MGFLLISAEIFVQQAMPLELVKKPLLENVTAGNWDDGI
jgi:hypothetical protein